jgi:hypothetical protein
MADRERQSSSYNHNYTPPEDEYLEQDEFQFPEHGGLTALIIGIGGGVVSILLPVIITLIARNLYEEAGRLGDKMPYQLAQTLFILTCVGIFLNAAVAFGAGYLTGRRVVRRMLGFYTGALVGAISYVGNVITNLIPGYPTRLTSGATAAAPASDSQQMLIGYLLLLVVLIVYALIGGLMGRWGAAAATNKHPYYEVGREA